MRELATTLEQDAAVKALSQRGQTFLASLIFVCVLSAFILGHVLLWHAEPLSQVAQWQAVLLDALPVKLWTLSAFERWSLVFGPLIIALICTLGVGLHSVHLSHRALQVVQDIEADAIDRAMRDPLTGLHNRTGFKIRLDQSLDMREDHELVGVIYVDLDRFKEVNDGFGHEMGDKLLIAVAERMHEITRYGTTIARLGGDEFAMIVEQREHVDDIVALAEEISSALGLPFLLGSTEVRIGGSVGVVIAPDDGADSTVLVRRADISMYRVKAAGRGQALRFAASMEDEIRRRRFLEEELRHAVARDQLEVFYQPFMASDGETLVGVEALLRWHHPEEGMISPVVFIPLAEESGLIVEIGEWVMRKAMTEAMDWPGIHLAINVSPVQFRRKNLLETTLQIVEEIGFDKRRLEVEITEGVLMEDADAAIALISGFRNEGIHVALDDFGTGYASLSYLRRFPFDKLKVDQAFVKNLGVSNGSAAIIHSVVALGRSLGMTVHAEGVETLEHHIFLRAAGCHHFQGFYFSKPMTRTALEAYMKKHNAIPLNYSMRA